MRRAYRSGQHRDTANADGNGPAEAGDASHRRDPSDAAAFPSITDRSGTDGDQLSEYYYDGDDIMDHVSYTNLSDYHGRDDADEEEDGDEDDHDEYNGDDDNDDDEDEDHDGGDYDNGDDDDETSDQDHGEHTEHESEDYSEGHDDPDGHHDAGDAHAHPFLTGSNRSGAFNLAFLNQLADFMAATGGQGIRPEDFARLRETVAQHLFTTTGMMSLQNLRPIVRRLERQVAAIDSDADGHGDDQLVATLHELQECLSVISHARDDAADDEDLSTDRAEVAEYMPLVAPLLRVLDKPGSPETSLLALKCIAFLVVLNSTVTQELVNRGLIGRLGGFLLTIEYIDVAEVALTIAARLAIAKTVFARRLLAEDGLVALLTFVDFFNQSTQIMALTAAQAVAAVVTATDYQSHVLPALPLLHGMLMNPTPDRQMVELQCRCLVQLVRGLAGHPEYLEQIVPESVITVLFRLADFPTAARVNISSGDGTVAVAVSPRSDEKPRGLGRTEILRLLSAVAAKSPRHASWMIKAGLADMLVSLLRLDANVATTALKDVDIADVCLLVASVVSLPQQFVYLRRLIGSLGVVLLDGLLESGSDELNSFVDVLEPAWYDFQQRTFMPTLLRYRLFAISLVVMYWRSTMRQTVAGRSNGMPWMDRAGFMVGAFGSRDAIFILLTFEFVQRILETIDRTAAADFAAALVRQGALFYLRRIAEVDGFSGFFHPLQNIWAPSTTSQTAFGGLMAMLVDRLSQFGVDVPFAAGKEDVTVTNGQRSRWLESALLLLIKKQAMIISQQLDDLVTTLDSRYKMSPEPAEALRRLKSQDDSLTEYELFETEGLASKLMVLLERSCDVAVLSRLYNMAHRAIFRYDHGLVVMMTAVSRTSPNAAGGGNNDQSRDDESMFAEPDFLEGLLFFARPLCLKVVVVRDGGSSGGDGTESTTVTRSLTADPLASVKSLLLLAVGDDRTRPSSQGSLLRTGNEQEEEEGEDGENVIDLSKKPEESRIPLDPTINYDLFIDNVRVSSDQTIFQSILTVKYAEAERFREMHKIWLQAPSMDFVVKRRSGPESTTVTVPADARSQMARPFIAALDMLSRLGRTARTLANDGASNQTVHQSTMIDYRMCAKLARQLQQPLVVCSSVPRWWKWIIAAYPFLFSFDIKFDFMAARYWSVPRALQHLHRRFQGTSVSRQTTGSSTRRRLSVNLSRLARTKIRVSRSNLFAAAQVVFAPKSLIADADKVLEIQYADEIGIGLGPTLEFYTLLSAEFQDSVRRLWHGSSGGADAVVASTGLFPALDTANDDDRLKQFELLGSFVARAILDGRIVDLPFNSLFLRYLLDSSNSLRGHLELVAGFDPELYQSLTRLDGLKDADLEGLFFTVPGYPHVELVTGGAALAVQANNTKQFVDCLVDHVFGSVVPRTIQAFRTGFGRMFSADALGQFTPEEFTIMINGDRNRGWQVGELLGTIKADHGYSSSSPQIHWFAEVACELNRDEKSALIQFLTGGPYLARGGWAALNPRFTIVCKSPSGEASSSGNKTYTSDDMLPSVMTCVNYLKLPRYSSKQVLRQRLLQAVHEGSRSFHLS